MRIVSVGFAPALAWLRSCSVTGIYRHAHQRRDKRRSNSPARRTIRPGKAAALLCALVVAAIGATAAFAIWHSREATLKEHQQDLDTMGVVLAEQTSR
jgi:hypothetical protein